MNNMMRKNNNRGGNKHRSGPRRYNNGGGGGGGGNRGANDSQNIQRQKHHATQQLGKYNDLARNAQINGDRVDVEYYLQHVDHYTRVLTDIAAIENERQAQHREAHGHQQSTQDANAPAAEGHHDGTTQDAQAATSDAQGGHEQLQADANPEPQAQQRPRQHRRPHHQNQEPSDNGAREANANREDIPLPGSILPPI